MLTLIPVPDELLLYIFQGSTRAEWKIETDKKGSDVTMARTTAPIQHLKSSQVTPTKNPATRGDRTTKASELRTVAEDAREQTGDTDVFLRMEQGDEDDAMEHDRGDGAEIPAIKAARKSRTQREDVAARLARAGKVPLNGAEMPAEPKSKKDKNKTKNTTVRPPKPAPPTMVPYKDILDNPSYKRSTVPFPPNLASSKAKAGTEGPTGLGPGSKVVHGDSTINRIHKFKSSDPAQHLPRFVRKTHPDDRATAHVERPDDGPKRRAQSPLAPLGQTKRVRMSSVASEASKDGSSPLPKSVLVTHSFTDEQLGSKPGGSGEYWLKNRVKKLTDKKIVGELPKPVTVILPAREEASLSSPLAHRGRQSSIQDDMTGEPTQFVVEEGARRAAQRQRLGGSPSGAAGDRLGGGLNSK